MNKLTIIGRLTHDPELRQTATNTSVCTFTVAADRSFKDSITGERKADFIKCVSWCNTAELIAKHFSKGSPILVEGSMRNNDYTDKDGIKHYNMLCQVEFMEFLPKTGVYATPAATENATDTTSIGDISDGDVPF